MAVIERGLTDPTPTSGVAIQLARDFLLGRALLADLPSHARALAAAVRLVEAELSMSSTTLGVYAYTPHTIVRVLGCDTQDASSVLDTMASEGLLQVVGDNPATAEGFRVLPTRAYQELQELLGEAS